MKKTAIVIFSLSFLSLLSLTSIAKAETSSGSVYNEVRINNNSSSTITSSSNSHSKVTITCNGQTYTYESNGESINADPCDGKSKVRINNDSTAKTTPQVTPNPTDIRKQIEEKKVEVKKKIEEEKAKLKATITAIPTPTQQVKSAVKFDLGAWIRSLFSSLFG